MATNNQVPTAAQIAKCVLLIRNERVMLDQDLANLYGVETKQLNRAVLRNQDRFPEDFAFRLSNHELTNLKCQIGTSSSWGGRRRSSPLVFTEQGVAMLSSVLTSKRAAQVNVVIMRAFVQMRQILLTHSGLSEKIKDLEGKIGKHDKEIAAIFSAIKELMLQPTPHVKRRIGF